MSKRASEVERANDGAVLSSYANFKTARRDFDTAEALHRRAIEASPKDVSVLNSYALFLKDVRMDFDAAEALYKRATEVEPENPIGLANYARS